MNWFTDVSQDISRVPDAIVYYEQELLNARKDCKIYGVIEKSLATLPGIVEHRFSQLQEIEAILEFLNIEHRKLKSFHFRKYLENYNRALTARECEKFTDGEPDVVGFEQIVNEFALLRNKWLGITKALDQKAYALNNITKLRVVGIEDASL